MSYNSNNYDIGEFENVEDYETYKVTKCARIWKTSEDIIKLNILGMSFFSSTKAGSCDNGFKIVVISIEDPSFI